MDLAKYRALFLEEASEHLTEMSRGLLALEKDPGSVESLDLIFRMAHSIKGMAASIGYDAIAEVAHALEDRIDACRAAGRIDDPEATAYLFQGLEQLERMVARVRETGEPPPPGESPPASADRPSEPDPDPQRKKVPS